MTTLSRARARRVKLVGLDVDGTMTDGGIYLGAVQTASGHQPIELKKYDIQDGLGIVFLRGAGIKVVIVTKRSSESVRLRAAELQVDGVAQDAKAQKITMWRKLLARHRVNEHEAAYIGDDLPDLAIMQTVGLPVAVANAVPEIRDLAAITLTKSGGNGAIREFSEMLLRARGDWQGCIERYISEPSTSKGSA
jgi:3-deoxy-D-manno-octulosonate 8-phosphate phosphatase (KDO 8-P phosphatase)